MRIPLFGKPEHFFVAAGLGTGHTDLTAFDAALLEAGVGNYNLLKVSSIVPADALQETRVTLPQGSLLPIAYGSTCTAEPGVRVTAAVSVALPEQGEVGLIMEYSGNLPEEEARRLVRRMAIEALALRGTRPREILVKSASGVAENGLWMCAFAGVALW